MTTDLLKIIIDPLLTNNTCFLCFNQRADLQNINSDLIIVENNFEWKVSVWKMMSQLFPYQETLSQQVCVTCSNVITNIYILMQRHNLKKRSILNITEKLQNEVSSIQTLQTVEKCYLKLSFHDAISNLTDQESSSTLISEVLQCTQCTMKFNSKEKLQVHMAICHNNTNKAVICHICGKKCKTPSSLKAHLNCHNEKQCPYCSKFLKTHSHYKVHVQNHMSSVKRVRKQTSYKCHDCSYNSLNKGSLEAHINKVHLRLRPYICPICCKSFFKKSNLTEHVGIHEKVKNETCEVCGENFVSKKTLMEHLRLHTKETPYECLICLKKFVTSGRRSDHVKRKHMDKTECCVFCNKLFSLRKELNRHVKKAHSQGDVPQEPVDGFVNNVVIMPMT